jgi:hypothetical protein
MELSKQLTSLKPSMRLRELGVPQESLFWWDDNELVVKTTLGFSTLGCEGVAGEPNWYKDSESTP